CRRPSTSPRRRCASIGRAPVASFSATIGAWAKKVPEALDDVFKNAAQRLVKELNDEVTRQVYDAAPAPSGYVRTGFLKASLVASDEACPDQVRDPPGVGVVPDDHIGTIILVVNGWEGDETLYLGYTARYGVVDHRGAP